MSVCLRVSSYTCAHTGVTLVAAVTIMATPGLPLPEIGENGEEEFERSWTKFKLVLVAAANKWDYAKALLMLPALLRGKLVEIYVSLEWNHV